MLVVITRVRAIRDIYMKGWELPWRWLKTDTVHRGLRETAAL